LVALVCILLVGAVILPKHSSAAIPELQSGISGYCLDDHKNMVTPNALVDSWECNGSAAQDWSAGIGTITHDDTYCLSVQNDGTASGTNVVSNTCDDAPGQVWLHDRGGYQNPNSGMCLDVPNGRTGIQLDISSCNTLSQPNEIWTSASSQKDTSPPSSSCNSGTEGERVACVTEQQWTAWQSGSPSHATLLNEYSDGNGYEEWCADFVSYVYKGAGYPFQQGEREGWDEYDANYVQYDGFTKHMVGSYQPKAGDLAFFNYPGGHIEVVVSGGKTPTFIYGDSATIDPVTGNGDMEANTISTDGPMGQVVYYLSPN
jgi:hypothetical protein